MQLDSRNKLQPLAYASRTLNQAEQNYSTTHKEALAVAWTLRHFKDLIYGYLIYVKTDHAAVVELFNQKHLSGKLARWSLIIQDFNTTFAYLPGKANVVADALSRNIAALQISGGDEFRISLIQAQRDDSFCAPLIYIYKRGRVCVCLSVCLSVCSQCTATLMNRFSCNFAWMFSCTRGLFCTT